MKVLLMCALLALSAGKPQRITPLDQRTSVVPNRDSREPVVPVDDSFENRNPAVTEDGQELFEADILLTAEQRAGRQAADNRWPGGQVSFAISSSSSGDRAAILAGINHWRDHTCIQFTEVAEGSSVQHIHFYKGKGCYSYIGKAAGFVQQKLSIGNNCAQLGVVVHEIGHAIGLYHQQSRNDRDTYVTILFENIAAEKEDNFKKISTANNYSVPYDLTSVMHYSSALFSKNGKNTIRVNNFLHEFLLGQRKGLSHRDKQIANAMYNCASGCTTPPTCQNGGFVGKSCTCVCPPNTSGVNCQMSTGSYYGDIDCGNADMTQEGTITSPNYPKNFPTNVVCWWVIKAPAGKRIRVSITDMQMLWRTDDGDCFWDHLALRYTGNVYNNDKLACDTELKGQSFTSNGNQFIVQFKSGNYGWFKGFSATVQFVG